MSEENKQIQPLQLIKHAKKSVELCIPDDFWSLVDVIMKEEVYMASNAFLDAYKENRLYVLHFEETDYLFEVRDILRPFILDNTFNSLPCYCILEANSNTRIEMIWAVPFLRRLGLASVFVREFKTTQVGLILPGAKPFWDALGVRYDTKPNNKPERVQETKNVESRTERKEKIELNEKGAQKCKVLLNEIDFLVDKWVGSGCDGHYCRQVEEKTSQLRTLFCFI